MAKVIKNVTFSWEWTGDERLLQGFNLAICKATEDPSTEVTASTFLRMSGTSETPVTLNPSYTFSNITLDDGLYYVPYVQAVYPGDDSDWLGATGILIEDDGTSTVAIQSQLQETFFQDSTPSGKYGDTWIDTNDGNKAYFHNGSSWVEGPYGTDGVNGTRTAILEMYQGAVSIPTTFPQGSSTYTWATGQFTAPTTPNSWQLTPPTLTAGQTLWICRTVYADNLTGTTTSITWPVTNYARAASSNGADGANGARTAILEVYKWQPTGTSSFSYPSGTSTYTWSTGVFDLPATPNGWSLTPGAATTGYTLFACKVVYTDTLTTSTSSVSWAAVSTAYVVGVAGIDGVSVTVTSSRQLSFTATDGTLDGSQSSIVLTAITSGITSPTYAWTFGGLVSNPGTTNASTCTITSAQFGTSKSAWVKCTVNGNSNYVGIATIVRLEKSTASAGATVGAPNGTYVGDILAQDVSTVIENSNGRGVNIANYAYSSFEQEVAPTFFIGATATATIDSTVSKIGTKCLKIVASGADAYAYLGVSSVGYNVTIEPNRKWILSAWVRGDSTSKLVSFHLKAGGTDYSFSGTTSSTINTWTRLAGEIDLSASAANSAILRVDNDAGAGVTVWFDAIMLEEKIGNGNIPSAYVEPTLRITDKIQSVISGINLPTTGMVTGLNVTQDYLGYYNGSAWKSYIGKDGKFLFEGNSTNKIGWDGSTLAIQGAIVTEGSITGTTLQTSPALSTGIKISTANGFEAFDSTGVKTVSIGTNGSATFKGNIEVTPSRNKIKNSEFSNGSSVEWTIGNEQVVATYDVLTDASVGGGEAYALRGCGTFALLHTSAQTDQTKYSYIFNELMPVVVGRNYEAQILTGVLGCKVQLGVNWYNSGSSYLNTSWIAGINDEEKAGGRFISDFKLLGGFVTAPASAAYGRIIAAKYSTKVGFGSSSHGLFTRAFLGEAYTGQTELSSYSPMGGNITGNIITGSTIQTATSGKRTAIYSSDYADAALAGELRIYDSTGQIVALGSNLSDGQYAIATIGHTTNGLVGVKAISSESYAIWGKSTNNIAIVGESSGTNPNAAGVFGSNSSSGPGISGYSNSGFGGIFTGNATKAALNLAPIASLPTNRSAGSICYYTAQGLCWANGTHWFKVVDNTQLT